MRFAYVCRDRGDQTAARMKVLKEHLRYMESVADKVLIAGPVPGATGETRRFAGSIVIYNVATREEADALFKADPYAAADLWERVDVVPFDPAMGTAIGGITWEFVDGEVHRTKTPV
jgi:uncharacterized protein YciI